jgi:diguanylate cyclase (GGDEF)-like protein
MMEARHRDPEAQQRRVVAIVIGLAAFAALVQAVLVQTKPAFEIGMLTMAATCLGSSVAVLRGRHIVAPTRIGIAVLALTYLALQVGTELPSGSGRVRNVAEIAAAMTWAPIPLILAWFLFDRALQRRVVAVAYFLAVAMPAAAFGMKHGWTALPPVLAMFTALLVTSGTVVVILIEFTRMHEAYAASRRAQDALERMAHTDPLTELPNRRRLMEELTREAAVAARFGLPLAVIEFDLDHFKEINDVYGHQIGDRVLIAVADHVQRRLRATDVVGRLGGEEFLVVVPGNTISEAKRLAEELCRSLRERPMAGDRAWVTGSFGVTVYEPGDTAEAILARADGALYCAKRDGRDRVATASREMQPYRTEKDPSGSAAAASVRRV